MKRFLMYVIVLTFIASTLTLSYESSFELGVESSGNNITGRDGTLYTKLGKSITLNGSSWEGTTEQSDCGKNSLILHNINEKILAGKIVVVSLSNIESAKKVWDDVNKNWKVIDDPSANTCSIMIAKKDNMYGDYAKVSGGWYKYSKMSYYTIQETGNYVVVIKTNDYDGTYTVNVRVADTAEFTKEDAVGNPLSDIGNKMHTYCILSGPEYLGVNYLADSKEYPFRNQPQYMEGNNGYYIQRSKINGNANIYWEHGNKYRNSKRVRYGILIYNNEEEAVDVNLMARAFIDAKNSPTAVLDVWGDYWDSGTSGKVQMEGDLSGVSNFVSIPGGQARWVCLYDLPEHYSDGEDELFNGILKLSLSKNGGMYSGEKVYCDEYIMDLDSMSCVDDFVVSNVSNAKREITQLFREKPEEYPNEFKSISDLRGSGDSAQLACKITSPTTINPETPFRFLVTGYDAPNINKNELICISDIMLANKDKFNSLEVNNKVNINILNTQDDFMKNCYNYGVVYRFDFDGNGKFQSQAGQKLFLKIKANNQVNPAAALVKFNGETLPVERWFGIYTIVKGIGSPVKKRLTQNDNELAIDLGESISKDFYIVISGMSSLPGEICIESAPQ